MADPADDADDDVGLAATEVSDRRLRERPAADPLQRKVARAKIAGALFQTEERVTLGRYHLLELVGSGGMGVVWAAWDPELDRRVAIKLVKATMQAARDRILLEGQALARLSHPNVVPVFDVGVVEQQVYLVMEYVRGKNLRAYCKPPRTVREIVAVYRDAALGLAAAHRAGLIHRDFKPDNAILGDDGRVRVLDFGLARGADPPSATGAGDAATPPTGSALTRGAGTPRYMPPEQAAGGELTAAVDQYALCVSLREALVGREVRPEGAADKEADVPRWLEAICARGTAHEPAARFPSMDELVRALGRDPRTVWGRRIVVTGALGLAAGAFVVGNLRASGADAPRCVGGAAEMDAVWSAPIETALAGRLATLSAFAAEESPTVIANLGRYRASWQTAHRGACLAHDRGELAPQMYERTLVCLARSKFAFAAAVDVLETATAEQLGGALIAATGLPDASRCATDAALSTVALPPPQLADQVAAVAREVEDARMFALASHERAVPAAAAALDHARALGYAPLIARAEVSHGLAAAVTDRDVAATEFDHATTAALAAGDDPLAIEAFARVVFNSATSLATRIDFAARLPVMQPIAIRLGDAARFERALLYMNLGLAANAAGDRGAARTWFETSRVEIADGKLRLNPELAMLPSNYALTVDDPGARDRLIGETIDALAGLVGGTHPLTLKAEALRAMWTRNPARAYELLEPSCKRMQQLHGTTSRTDIGDCAYNLAALAIELDQRDVAHRWFAVSLAHVSPPAPRADLCATMLAVTGGRPAEAVRLAESWLRDHANAEGWMRYFVAEQHLAAGFAHEDLGRPAAAIASYRAALAIFDALMATVPATIARHRTRTQARLARLLAASDPARAAELATAASEWYRAATGYDAEVAALEPIRTAGSR
jgi:tetratricopeptide (TPR) repeat protein